MKRTLAAIVIILGLAALAAALFLRARPSGYLTDGASISEPADAARPRQVLWSPAEPASAALATSDEELQPRWSPDGRTLFFARAGADGQTDLWRIERHADGWSEPAPIDTLNTGANDLAPEPSADGRYLYFASDREDGAGGLDLWLSEIIEGAFQPPINLGPRINSPFDESGPALTPDGTVLFFSTTRPSRGDPTTDVSSQAPEAQLERRIDHDIFRVVLDDPVARAEPVAALSSDGHDGGPDVSPYGDFIYFASDRAGGRGGLDLYRAPLRHGVPGAPENLGPAINTDAHELDPAVSWGGFRLHFASDRGGGDEIGRLDHDLYESTSREVRLEHDRAVAQFDRDTLLLAVFWLLMIAASAFLLWLLWRMLRNAKIGPASLIARCLLASMIVHVLLMLLFTIWQVGSALSDRWRPGSAVRLAATVDGTGLATQVRGGLTAVQFAPRELESEMAMVATTMTPPAPVERADAPSVAPAPAEAMARAEAFDVRGPMLDLEPTRPADAPSQADAALPAPPVPAREAGAETAVTAPESAVASSSSAAPRPTPAPTPLAAEAPAPQTDVSARAEADPKVPARIEPAPTADPTFTPVEFAAAASTPPAPADAAPARAGQEVAVTPAAPSAASPRNASADAPRAVASAADRATAPSVDVSPAPVARARAADAPDRPLIDAPPAAAPAPVVTVGVPVPADAVRAARTGETDAEPSAALAALPATTPVDDASAVPRPTRVRAPSAVTGAEGSAPPRPLTAPDVKTPAPPENAAQPPAALAAAAPVAPPLPPPDDRADRTPIGETPADPSIDALPRAAAARAREAASAPAPDTPTAATIAPQLAEATTTAAPQPLPAPTTAPPVPTDDLPAPSAPAAPAAALAADLPVPAEGAPAAPAAAAETEAAPAWTQLAAPTTAPLVDVTDAPGAVAVDTRALAASPAADSTVRPLTTPDAVTAAPPETDGTAPPALLAAAPNDGPTLPAPTDLGAPDTEAREAAETPADVDLPPLRRADAVPEAAPSAPATAPSPVGIPLDAVAAAPAKRAWDAPPPATAVPDAIVALPAPAASAEVADMPLALAPPSDLPLTYDAARGSAAPSAAAATDVPLAVPAALASGAPDAVPVLPLAQPPLPRAAPDAQPLTKSETPKPDLAPPTMLAETVPLEPLTPPAAPIAVLPLPDETEMPQNPFEHRKPERRRELLAKTGGTPETEAAVEAALAWLASVQRPDGGWDGESFGARAPVDTALTGLSILCFLAADHTHVHAGPYQQTVERALEWLVNRQDDRGSFLGRESMYSHAIATIAIAEAYGMSGDAALREHVRDATKFIVDARHSRTGGWRYAPGQFGDTSVLGWQVMALTSARKTGIDVPEEAFETGRRWLNRVASGDGRYAYQPGQEPSPAMTAESMFVWQLLGRNDTDRTMRASADYLLANPPRWHQSSSTYYWYYATLALYQHQDAAWNRWNRRVRDVLVSGQHKQGALAGSWDPLDRWADTGGRIYQTAICTLTLEVYYRYLPLFMKER